MKILVTGAKGQLGTEIRKCIERGYTELGVPSVLKSGVVADYVDIDSLDISDLGALREAFAGQGPILKRIQPVSKGRAHRINKRTSHITIVLDTKVK